MPGLSNPGLEYNTVGSPGGMVSPVVGRAALAAGAIIAGMPGFGYGPIYKFDAGGGSYITYSFGAAPSSVTGESASTGVNPTETSYALYGHIVPLSVFGVGRIGGDIIAGPWVENGLATFCISFGVPADPYGSRTLREIAFDSEVVWENGAFNTEAFTFRFYPGRLDQAVDPVETVHWGADGVAYRPQILLWFENLPIKNTKFQKIPYVAAVIADSTGDDVNLGEAFTRLATSPWVNYTSAQFETIGVTDGLPNGGLIIAQDAEFLSTIQQFGRFFRNWNILQTDKLRIVDRGAAVAADIALDRTTLMNKNVFSRGEVTSIPRILELSTIDPEADFTVVPSQAVRPREPVNVTASVSTESVYLPMIMDTHTRQSLVTYTKYQEEIARKKVTGTAMMHGVEIEPGDLVAITGLGADFEDTTFKVIETLHGANYSVEFTAESFMDCGIPTGDPLFSYVVLLLGFEDVDGSIGTPGFTDESSRHHGTGTGGGVLPDFTEIDTAQFKFGMSSARIYRAPVLYDSSLDWNLGSGQFTIEVWARFNSISGSAQLIFETTLSAWSLSLVGAVPAEIQFGFTTLAGGALTTTSAGIATATWYHLAVDKDSSGKIRIYVNGVMRGSATAADTVSGATPQLRLGTAGSSRLDGWLDEIRITKGIARYASDGGFPVPTNAYPRTGV